MIWSDRGKIYGLPASEEDWRKLSRMAFGVEDVRKVKVVAVYNWKRQVDRRTAPYTCAHLIRNPVTKDGLCGADVMKPRCADVPLTKCPFKAVSIETGKEQKPRFVHVEKDSED